MAVASIDMIEFSLRDVAQRVQDECKGDARKYVAARKEMIRQIASSPDNWANVQASAARWYVVDLHLVAESLFDGLARDISAFRQQSPVQTGQTVDSLDRLLAAIPRTNANKLRDSLEYALSQYYRHVRNRIFHEKSDAQLKNLHRKIHDEFGEAISKQYSVTVAPHTWTELSFDDFRLYARTLLRLGYMLNDAISINADEVLTFMRGLGVENRPWMRSKGRGIASVQKLIRKRLMVEFEVADEAFLAAVSGELARDVMETESADVRHRRRRAAKRQK